MQDRIRKQMTEAFKAGRKGETSILRVLLGEVQRAEADPGKKTDPVKIVRKLMENNVEAIGRYKDQESKDRLEAENKILETFLPTYLNKDEIKVKLLPMVEQLKGAKNDGMATGLAMKSLAGEMVEGGTVKQAVGELRAE